MHRKLLFLIPVLALGVIWAVVPTKAQIDPMFQLKWGMVGITPNQVGRLNVVSDGMDACTLALGFNDSDGHVLQAEFHALRAGRADFLDIMGSRAVQRGDQRSEIRPFVQAPTTGIPTGFPPDPCRSFSATYEVFERGSGQTTVFALPGTAVLSTIPLDGFQVR